MSQSLETKIELSVQAIDSLTKAFEEYKCETNKKLDSLTAKVDNLGESYVRKDEFHEFKNSVEKNIVTRAEFNPLQKWLWGLLAGVSLFVLLGIIGSFTNFSK